MIAVTIYGRPGCHLCDEAREMILGLDREGIRLRLQEVNIELDDELHRAYLERIPVVEIGGEIVSELVPDAVAIRSALARTGTVGLT